MERNNSQSINMFAFDESASAGLSGSQFAEERRMRMHIRRAGRPFCGGEKKNSIIGGHERNEIMKRDEKSSSSQLLDQLIGMIKNEMAFLVNKVNGIDSLDKIIYQLCLQEVA